MTSSPKSRDRWRAALVFVTAAAITAAHYAARPEHVGHHDLLQRLYYIPIILAGFWFGPRGGLLVSGLITAVYVHHIHFTLAGDFLGGNFDRTLELAMYNVVGAITGSLTRRLRLEHGRYRKASEALELSYSQLDQAYVKLKAQTEALLSAEAQLRKADRLTSLGELSAALAHEIRNPLGGIKGAAEILSDQFTEDDPAYEFAAILKKEVGRLDEVLSAFLSYARPVGDAQDIVCDPASVLYDVLKLASPGLKDVGLRVTLEIPPELPQVYFGAEQLTQVALNIILNAQAACLPGDSVTVTATERAGRVLLVFGDTGHGMPEEQRERVFEPFFTTREDGTGLGLAIVKRIADSFSATIEVTSRLGQGTAFSLSLMVAEGMGKIDGQNLAN